MSLHKYRLGELIELLEHISCDKFIKGNILGFFDFYCVQDQ